MATGGVDWDGSFTHQHDWRDANSAMIELEKGLRSSNIGEQCEAIVRFPKLFEKFPFPILVNSAFMKLTDLFYSGSNFLRLCILQVTKDSRKHLGKILNVEDCVRRLYSVMLSNDPVARAITLRVFGNIASIIAEHKNIHHSIQHSLDSHDHIELEGAILASYRLSAESATFASAICSKIANMIQGMGTSIEVKIKMIRILRYMHHDEESISKARQLCHTLLIAYPGSNFVKITLHVLSLLSIKSVLDISHQISFLLNYLKSDQRLEIRRIAIQDLRLFARKVPHMWNKEDIQGLCEILLSFPQQEIQILILRTLVILAHSVAVKCMAECEDIVKVFERFGLHANLAFAALTLDFCSSVANSDHYERKYTATDGTEFYQQLEVGIEMLLISYATSKKVHKEIEKLCFRCIKNIIQVYTLARNSLIQLVSAIIPNVDVSIGVMLCNILKIIGANSQLFEAIKVILQKLSNTSQNLSESQDNSNSTIVAIVTLLSYGIPHVDDENNLQMFSLLAPFIDVLKANGNYWSVFCIARSSAQVGFFSVASPLFKQLTIKVSSESYYFYLTALHHFCHAENRIASFLFEDNRSTDLSLCLMDACNAYHKGLTALKASVTPKHSLTFQCKFAKLRADFLQVGMTLSSFCSAMNTTVYSTSTTNIVNLPQWGAYARTFRTISEDLEILYNQSFDADLNSLDNLKMFQQSCLLMAYCIELLTANSVRVTSEGLLNQDVTLNLADVNICRYPNMNKFHKEVTDRIAEFAEKCKGRNFNQSHGFYVRAILSTLLKVPFRYPSYFFVGQQTTKITLAVSPNARHPNEPILVILPTQLLMKVEGIIQHGSRQGIHRRLKSISLTLNATVKEALNDTEAYFKATTDIVLRQVVEPKNDYFSAQFLLNFSLPSLYNVHIDVSVIDENSVSWHTGPQRDIPVRCNAGNNSSNFASQR